MPFHTRTLSNGLTIIGESIPSSRAVAVGFFVRTGARDEPGEISGVSHFLEHMLFKGTPRRTARDVNLHFDRIGSKSNAETGEESTFYYAAVLPEYLTEAVDILADILRPSLREDDFDTEKKVILEEIEKYLDMPGNVAYELARRLHFAEHPLGNSILGTAQTVGDMTAEQMRAYFEKWYVASNITVTIAGQFDWPAVVAMIEQRCGGWQAGDAKRGHLVAAAGSGKMEIVTRPPEKVQQEYVWTLGAGPPTESPKRYAADILAMAVGDDSGSRLYWELIHNGYAESAGTAYFENQANGTFFSGFTSEPKLAAKNLKRLGKVLSGVQSEGITEDELRLAKNKITARIVRSGERTMNRMRSIVAAWVYNNEYRDVDIELSRYQAVKLSDVRGVLDEYPLDRTSTMLFGPLKKL